MVMTASMTSAPRIRLISPTGPLPGGDDLMAARFPILFVNNEFSLTASQPGDIYEPKLTYKRKSKEVQK